MLRPGHVGHRMATEHTSDLLGQSLVILSSEASPPKPLFREELCLSTSLPTNNLGLLRYLFVAVPGTQ